jgi:hypothetical protein
MPIPFYDFKNLPAKLFDPDKPQPFRHALPAWRSLGMSAIVDHVAGNGVLTSQNGIQRLVVWREGGDMPLATADMTTVAIDDELSVSWSGPTPPGPTDLDNGNPLDLRCVGLILADGNVWQIPEIREPDYSSRLPRDLVRDRKTGKLTAPIKREYEDMWQEAEFWFDRFLAILEGTEFTFSRERALAFCTQLLGLRYRFCDATQSALRVIDTTNLQAIIGIAISWQSVMDRVRDIVADDVEEKKNLDRSAASVNGSSGSEASDHNTDQQGANSG